MLRSSVFAAAAAMALAVAPAYAQVKWDLPSAYPADNFHSENLAAFARDVADAALANDREQRNPRDNDRGSVQRAHGRVPDRRA